jgi:hypothetical protein
MAKEAWEMNFGKGSSYFRKIRFTSEKFHGPRFAAGPSGPESFS